MPAPRVSVPEKDQSQYISLASTSKGGMGGVCERGPVNAPLLMKSWGEFLANFGDLLPTSYLAYCAKVALDLGCTVYVNRITSLDGGGLSKALFSEIMLQTASGGLTAAKVTGNIAGVLWQALRTWAFVSGNKLAFKVDGGAKVFATLTGTPATKSTGNAPFNIQNGDWFSYRSGPSNAPGPERRITFAGVTGGAATAAQVQSNFADQFIGVHSVVNGAAVDLTTDHKGSAARLEFVADSGAGAILAALGFAVEVKVGGGNVADIDHVTSTELNTLLVAADPGVLFSVNASFFGVLERTLTGVTKTLQVVTSDQNETDGAAVLGWNTTLVAGTSNSPVDTLKIVAESPGTWADGATGGLTVDTAAAKTAPATRFRIVVKRGGVGVEAHEELSMDSADARYVVNVLATESAYIRAEDEECGLSVALARPAFATGQALAGGDDGLSGLGDSDFIGDSAKKTGQYAWSRVTDVSFIGNPGIVSRDVILSGQAYCEARKDCEFINDLPQTLNASQSKDFRFATGAYAGGSLFDSSYGSCYAPWVSIIDPKTKLEKFVPPMGWAFAARAFTDRVAKPWFAPAGGARGKVRNAKKLYHYFSQEEGGDTDVLCDAGINPIVNDPQFGFIINGERTLQVTQSKLDRIHVRRLIILIRTSIQPGVKAVGLFEPNDPITWRALESLLEPFFKTIQDGRGLNRKAAIICNADTNPPQDIANHKLTCQIFINPTDDVEDMQLPLFITPNGASLGEPV